MYSSFEFVSRAISPSLVAREGETCRYVSNQGEQAGQPAVMQNRKLVQKFVVASQRWSRVGSQGSSTTVHYLGKWPPLFDPWHLLSGVSAHYRVP